MRVLILTPEFENAPGGIATFYRNLAASLRRLDVDIRIIEGSAVQAGARAPHIVDGVEVETLERDRLQRWWEQFPAFAATPGLRRHLAAAWAMWEQAAFGAEADIVEATDWGLLFIPPAVEANTPLIVQAHGSVGQIAVHDPLEGEETQCAFERLIESATLTSPVLQTLSRANADFWRAETGRPVETIRPAVPLPAGGTRDVSARGLVVGRIQRWKGPHVLCEALQLLGERAPDCDWFGRDTAFGRHGTSTVQDLAERYPGVWRTRVRPHPPVAAGEVAVRQAGALFNLVPSSWDVFNFTAAEAMASGRPTIVSTSAGASELVVDGENGFLFAAGDASALAGAIDRVLSSTPPRLAEIGVAGRETIRRELDPAMIAETRIAAYRSAIEAFRSAPPAPIGGWLGELCRPSSGTPVDGAFLGQFPVRTLTSHLAGRVRDKVGSVLRGGGR
jgi:glycosyltransferase involved in cell wall biosynthesis